jgi:hypothetical protein
MKSGVPKKSSAKIHPQDQTSAGIEYSLIFKAISGAL